MVPDGRDQRSERRWLGFMVSQVRKSGDGAPDFVVRAWTTPGNMSSMIGAICVIIEYAMEDQDAD